MQFFISYTAVDRAWAEWIAAALEDAGFATALQAWDFRPGEDFVERMDRAMRDSERTIAVLSRDYYRSSFAVPEWVGRSRSRTPASRSQPVPTSSASSPVTYPNPGCAAAAPLRRVSNAA